MRSGRNKKKDVLGRILLSLLKNISLIESLWTRIAVISSVIEFKKDKRLRTSAVIAFDLNS